MSKKECDTQNVHMVNLLVELDLLRSCKPTKKTDQHSLQCTIVQYTLELLLVKNYQSYKTSKIEKLTIVPYTLELLLMKSYQSYKTLLSIQLLLQHTLWSFCS